MDATHDVGGQQSPPAPGAVLETAERLREDIRVTGQVLHDHVEELRHHLNHRVESLRNPFGLRESVAESPLVACSVAFVAGLVLSGVRSRPVPTAIVQHVGGALGSSLAGQIAARMLRSLGV
jgi:hypothetical protein